MNGETDEVVEDAAAGGAAVRDVTSQRARKRRRVSDEALVAALRANGGYISTTAKACGLSPSAISMRIARNPKLKEAADEIRNAQLDMVENALMLNIQNRDQRAIEFFLKCRGKERGWVEQTASEVTVKASAGTKFSRAELLEIAGATEASAP